jgi:hypothetical protein
MKMNMNPMTDLDSANLIRCTELEARLLRPQVSFPEWLVDRSLPFTTFFREGFLTSESFYRLLNQNVPKKETVAMVVYVDYPVPIRRQIERDLSEAEWATWVQKMDNAIFWPVDGKAYVFALNGGFVTYAEIDRPTIVYSDSPLTLSDDLEGQAIPTSEVPEDFQGSYFPYAHDDIDELVTLEGRFRQNYLPNSDASWVYRRDG